MRNKLAEILTFGFSIPEHGNRGKMQILNLRCANLETEILQSQNMPITIISILILRIRDNECGKMRQPKIQTNLELAIFSLFTVSCEDSNAQTTEIAGQLWVVS